MLRRFFVPQTTSLVSPFFDFLMAGGISILLFGVFQFAIDHEASVVTWSIALYYASLVVNFPHFMASYHLLYGDAKQYFFTFRERPRFTLKLWWAGVVVPVILIGYFMWALVTENLSLMGYMVNAMYFFVGWHYIKQIYGCVIVLSAAKKIYYDVVERWTILLPLYTLWILSYLNVNTAGVDYMFFSIPFEGLSLPYILVEWAELCLLLTTVGVIAMFILRRMRHQPLPPMAALAALVSIYLWYIPALYHPAYFFIIPLLHSLQYLLFVIAHRRNVTVRTALTDGPARVAAMTRLTLLGGGLFLLLPSLLIITLLLMQYQTTLEHWFFQWGSAASISLVVQTAAGLLVLVGFGVAWWRQRSRQYPVSAFLGFFMWMFLLGFLSFLFIPQFLDMLVRKNLGWDGLMYPTQTFGLALYAFFFTLFINIHHYFIDNVIWKQDNPSLRGSLFLKDDEVERSPI